MTNPTTDHDDIADDIRDRVGDGPEDDGEPFLPITPTLRDVVDGQVLALLRAQTQEAVRCATDAIHAAVHRNDPPVPDAFDRLEEILKRPEVMPLVEMVVARLVSSAFKAPAASPTPSAYTPPVAPDVTIGVIVDGRTVGTVTVPLDASGNTVLDYIREDALLASKVAGKTLDEYAVGKFAKFSTTVQ